MNIQIKNRNISKSLSETKLKRASQNCHVFKVKIQNNSLNSLQKEKLKMFFVEAKWIYNDILNFTKDGERKIDEYDFKVREITKLDKNRQEVKQGLNHIHSQIKQTLIYNIKTSIKVLAKLKKKNLKVGWLKYKSEINSLDLKQYGSSYEILSKNKIRIGGIRKPVRVNGLSQFINIPNIEFANAKLLNTPAGYYLAITCYVPKETKITKHQNKNKETIGIDFGCSTAFTLSNGKKYNVYVKETERLKTLQRKLARQKKGSNNRYKTISKIKKEYQKLFNQKNDLTNKFIYELSCYDKIIIQDEQLTQWKVNHGKKIQHSILGRVKAKLIQQDNVIILNKWLPTTKYCRKCGEMVDISLSQRMFKCPICKESEDRDVHAAKNMIWFYENNIGVGRTEFKRMELENLKSQATKYEDARS